MPHDNEGAPVAEPRGRMHLLASTVLLVLTIGIGSCGSKVEHAPAAQPAATPAPTPGEPAQAPAPVETVAQQVSQPAPPASSEAMAPASLDELLAPIALYSDALLAQVLAAAANPQEVMDGGNWLLQNTSLKGQSLQDAAKQAGFGPPMQALVMFPTVVDMMCQNFDWTKQLGSAFNTDQGAVMASVQRLRAQAAAVGNLKSTPQQKVETQTVDKQQVIVIQPADPKVIYVPTYNPQVVYTTPPPPPPAAGPTTGDVVAAGLIGFTAGVIVGSMFNNNNYYPYPNWGGGGVWYGGNPYHRNVYVYAPNYNRGYPPGYRPGYGYRPPANYPNGWNRASTLPAYNSSNYYNRFNGNQNLRPGNSPPPLVGNNINNRPGAYRPNYGNSTIGRGNTSNSGNNVTINNNFNNSNRPGRTGAGTTGGGAAAPSWKGQQQYQGARPGSANGRPGADRGFGSASSGSQPGRTASIPTRPATPMTGAANPGARPASPATRPGTGGGRSATDRGLGGASSGSQPIRTGAAPARPATARPASPVTRPAAPPTGTSRQTAFAGASAGRGGAGSGAQQDRSAANRGRASVGGGGTRPTPPQQRGARK